MPFNQVSGPRDACASKVLSNFVDSRAERRHFTPFFGRHEPHSKLFAEANQPEKDGPEKDGLRSDTSERLVYNKGAAHWLRKAVAINPGIAAKLLPGSEPDLERLFKVEVDLLRDSGGRVHNN